MRGPLLSLCFVGLAFSWMVFLGAGFRQADWNASMLFLGASAIFYWSFRTGQTPPRIPSWNLAALWALPAFAAFQLIPLPSGMLATVSPARYLIATSLSAVIPNITTAPIAVAPAASMFGLFSLLACLTIFSLLRDFEWRLADSRPWLPTLPLIAIAGVEASVGVGQWIGGTPASALHGTLARTEYFDGLLEVALPFSLVFGYISFRRHQTREDASVIPATRAVTAWLASFLILIAIFHTASSTARVVVFSSLYILLALALIPRLKTLRLQMVASGGAALFAIIVTLISVSPADFAASLAQLGANNESAAEQRLVLWNNSANLLSDYRWVGTGMGGFEPTFLRYQGSADLNRIQQPHNDVLSLLISFGALGGCIVLAVLVGIMRPAILGAIYQINENRRLLAASITAALFGALLRSGLESALSVPVLAMAFAWVAGMSQSSGVD